MVKRILGIIAYVLVFSLLFTGFSKALMHKQVEGGRNMTQKVAGFYNEESESFDAIFFGSSHIYCSLDPTAFKEETGLDSYVFASQFQPLWLSYHYLVEALKTQKPKSVVLEVNMLAQNPDKEYQDEGTNHAAIDPLPFSKNKLDMIFAAAPKGERRYYIFHLMKYHDRWEELEEIDFTRTYEKETDPDKGFVLLEGTVKAPVWEDVSHVVDAVDLGASSGTGPGSDGGDDKLKGARKGLAYIEKFIDLAQESGVEVVLLKTPSNATVEEKMYYNAVGKLAQEKKVTYWDFNTKAHYEAMDLIVDEDYYDQGHLNSTGVAKFMKYLGQHWSGLALD